MLLQAAALAAIAAADSFAVWALAAILLGAGTAAVYPTRLAGIIAGIRAAVWVVAALTAASGLLAWARMYETHPRSSEDHSPS